MFALLLTAALALAAPLTGGGGAQAAHGRDGRQIMADTQGLTVYTFAPDKADLSTCYNGCAKEWPPVLVKGQTAAPFGVTVRKDGTKQLTYNHRPLYNYDDDKVTGDMFGEGKGGIWFVVEVKTQPAPKPAPAKK